MTIHVEDIWRAVAEHYNVPLATMTGAALARRYSRPRQVAMTLSRELTKASLPDLGRRFKRDHTTVFYATQAVARRVARGYPEADAMTVIRAKLEKDGCRCWRARTVTVFEGRQRATASDPVRPTQH